jgi:Na+/proline symporter
MDISLIDGLIIIIPLSLFMVLGFIQRKKAGKNQEEFFLSGRQMPWWLLGISMVATTFSADTPNLVTDIVRKNGVSGNWVWWAFLLTGMLTVFVFAKLWRRSGMLTDLEFYEVRYGGKKAAFLRGFRAVYLGFFFNIVIMAGVMLAGIKIMSVILDWSPIQTILISGIITVTYSALGGLRSVLIADLFQFIIAMIGTIWAAIYIINMPEVGSLTQLFTHELVEGKLSIFPDFTDTQNLWMVFIIPLAVQWWSVWYPGSEPGGGGYIVQRMLAARNERQALYATLFFNFAHYALRPWPWILIALASLIYFPTVADLGTAFPSISDQILNDDLAYPAMLAMLPKGLLGLVLLSLISAFMSTISTHLNWGSSYIANDFYKRFIHPEANDRHLVNIGRLSTVLLLIFAAILALYLESALDAFQILLQIGAGTGLIFILRWFWWRINAYSELTAMIVSFIIALLFEFIPAFETLNTSVKLVSGVLITTIFWVSVTLLTSAENDKVLVRFLRLTKPHLIGWKGFIKKYRGNVQIPDSPDRLGIEMGGFFVGVLGVYSLLFGTGFLLYGQYWAALLCGITFLVSSIYLINVIKKLWSTYSPSDTS